MRYIKLKEPFLLTLGACRQWDQLLLSQLVAARIASAFGVDLLRLTKLATARALRYGTAFLLYFEKGTVGVMARRRSVALYAGLAERTVFSGWVGG